MIISKRIQIFLQIFICLLFCFSACYATGYGFNYLDAERDVIIGTLGTFLVLIFLSFFSIRLVNIVLLIYVITTTLYFPVGWLYGSPTFKVIGALMETDIQESFEFLIFVPKRVWLLQIVYLILGIITWKICAKSWQLTQKWQKKYRYYTAAGILVLLLTPPLGTYLSGGSFQDDESSIPVTIVGFHTDMIVAPYIYLSKKKELLHQASLPSTWHIRSVQPKYKNYILIIGESERSDYMNVYGFTLPNTPFLSQSNGIFVDGYISTASYTMASLPATLSFRNQSYNNIISLAKQAGFSTAWLSNQGMLGFFSNEVSSYAARSDYSFFTQRGDYQKSISMNDRMLLPQLEKFLKQPTDKPRLVVLHLMGSHQDFCKRLDKEVLFDYKSKKLSCYVSTIYQTDALLRDVVEQLKRQNESYSLIYFSDHGLKHEALGTKEATLIHGGDTYQSFTVPLIKLSSDDTNHQKIKTQRSAFNFLKGFSQWMGIQVDELKVDDYDFFGAEPDKEDSNNNLGRVNGLRQDPILP